ncbi:hypothetical protein SRHO_G00154740 [Serrasalmus rhombeus]
MVTPNINHTINQACERRGLKLNGRFALNALKKNNNFSSLWVNAENGVESSFLALEGRIQRCQRKSEPRGSSDRYLVMVKSTTEHVSHCTWSH